MVDEQLAYKPGENKEPVLKVTTPDGEVVTYSATEARLMGFNPENLSDDRKLYTYTDDNGNLRLTTDYTDLPASITLDESTGNIKVSAPKVITEMPEFQQAFNYDALKTYSQAYKLNPDYKVKITEYDEETGEEKGEKEVTIPEWVQNRNDALHLFMKRVKSAEEDRRALAAEYGDKAYNLSLTQIIMSQQYGKYTYVPEVLKSIGSSFGDDPTKTNPILKILDKIDDDGKISAEDLKDIYNRDEFGRSELAGIMAVIDGALKGGEWGDTYYEDENGEKVYNKASAEEAAKLLAFKSFLESHHPDGSWWQETAGNIEAWSVNAAYGMTRVVWNVANDFEGFFSGGSSKKMQNDIKSLDQTMQFYNQTRSLESEAAQTIAFLSMIGGTLAGSWAVGKVAALPFQAAGSAFSAIGNAAKAAIDAGEVAKGARFVVAMSSAAEKAALASGVYKAFMKAHPALDFTVKFLLDTVHDALLYDSTTLRDALETADTDLHDYWMGQLADNAKWWGGMSFAKGVMRIAGKTRLGQWANIRATRFINRVAAAIGEKKAAFKDKVHGGSIINSLEDKLEDAINKKNFKSANRIKRKLDIEKQNVLLREARSQLGHLDLDFEHWKLTDESRMAYNDAKTRIKGLEVGVDKYRRSIEYQRQSIVGKQVDPSTGKVTFINPSIGMADVNASQSYFKLAELAKAHNLPLMDNSMISQEMANYWTSRYYERIAEGFSKNQTDAGARATRALPTIRANIDAAADKLPDDIVKAIDEIVDKKVFQSYYLEQNEYGMAKGILNRAKVEGYHENPVWAENGYMPIVTKFEDKGGMYIEAQGRLDAKITDEMEHLKFDVKLGQDYQDPELVRQSRLSGLAQMEVNSQLFKAYSGYGSDARNVTVISGEQTEYVRILKENREYLEKAVEKSARGVGENLVNDLKINKVRSRPPIKYTTVPESDRVTVVASMSPEQVNGFLVERKYIEPDQKITNTVTAANYDEWYDNQTPSVKKFLAQQYQTYDPENYTARYTAKDITTGSANSDVRTSLAQSVADESNGEKLVAWRTQSTGVDKFYGSAGGTSAPNDVERAKWEGGRWTSIGGEPWSIGGYGDQKLAFPVKKADILDKYAISEYEDTAHELYVMKYGKKAEKEIYLKSYEQLGQSVEDLPHYAEISGLRKSDLKKVADGDPKALLDVSNKKIIQYDAGDASRQYVMFPDRNPELFKEGVKDMAEMSKLKARGTYDEFKMAADAGGQDFEDALQRATLVGDKDFARSGLMNEARHNLDMGREAFYQGVLVAQVKANLRNVKRVDVSTLVDDLTTEFKELLDDYTDGVLQDKGAMVAITALSETTDASEEFAKYIALRRLAEGGMDEAYKSIDAALDKKIDELKTINTPDAKTIKKQAHKLFKDTVETELDDLSQTVRAINPELVDTKGIYTKAKELDQQIRGLDPVKNKNSDNGIAMYLDNEGRQVFAEVDPAFASLYNYRYEMDAVEASYMAKINAFTARWFRYGTTTVNLKAFGNQLFRDFGNALFIGGSWHTIKYYRQNLVDVFGKNIVEQIGRFDPTGYEMKQLEQIAETNKQSLEEAAVSRELMRGAAMSPTTTEHTLYKRFMKDTYGGTEGRLTAIKDRFQNFVDEHKLNPEYWLNDKRENYLRNRVYAHSLNEAFESGYDLQQARVFAEFAMNNATTNFTRQLYHLQAIADSTPYFRAAINGSKSFWRMWSLDPVGITGRITGGLIIPVMYLTGASLGSKENYDVYKNIPEYQKQDNLVFVVHGEIISAPLPQEIAPIVAPFRQFVEFLHGTNRNDFWELMMNDTLGFFPYDLTGFSTIDMDKMIQDPTIFDRISRGVARVFSQMAPVPAKTVYMLASGTDPYTGKNLRNPKYSYWNEETGAVETMDYNSNVFAKEFCSLPFIKDWVSPELAEKVVSGVIGTTGSNLLSDITALLKNGPEAAAEEALKNITESVAAPFTVPKYNLIDAIWKREVKVLTALKEQVLHSTEMETINKQLAQEKDPEKRNKLLAARRNLTNPYQQKVKSMVDRLENEYYGTFDAQKFSAVIQLLNFDTDPIYQTASQYASNLATDIYYEGRDAAIQTMRALGIDGVHDNSIFGYLTRDKQTGEIVMRYNSPIAIMDMDLTWNNQKNYHLANIKALVSQNDLWDAKEAVDAKIDAIYSKGKLSNADYDMIDQIYVDWNAEVMKVLAPYVETMTPEAAINNTEVIKYLSGLVEVPGDFKKDKYGRYVTNSKLGEGSANDAYVRSYIKYIFGINDTGYKSGRNYSDRQNYDEENKRWTK